MRKSNRMTEGVWINAAGGEWLSIPSILHGNRKLFGVRES
jgi:hypothetical protein